jgi:hypothetical protein
MASRKVLKSVSHNLVHSFTSLMNYGFNDYVMGHLLTAARKTESNTLLIDLVNQMSSPVELLTPFVAESASQYIQNFPSLVVSSGSSCDLIKAATIRITYDLSVTKPHPNHPRLLESPYTATGRIVDDQDKVYETTLTGWWYPEQ